MGDSGALRTRVIQKTSVMIRVRNIVGPVIGFLVKFLGSVGLVSRNLNWVRES